MLSKMKDSDLENDLQIKIRLHRLKILESLALLNTSEAPILEERNSNLSSADSAKPPSENSSQGLIENKPPEESKAQHKMSLKFLEGDLVNTVFGVLESGINIGRHNTFNEVVITEGTISRKHCRVFYDNKGFFIEDVGSTTGTFIMLKSKTIITEGKQEQNN